MRRSRSCLLWTTTSSPSLRSATCAPTRLPTPQFPFVPYRRSDKWMDRPPPSCPPPPLPLPSVPPSTMFFVSASLTFGHVLCLDRSVVFGDKVLVARSERVQHTCGAVSACALDLEFPRSLPPSPPSPIAPPQGCLLGMGYGWRSSAGRICLTDGG